LSILDAILTLLIAAPAALGLWKGIIQPACTLGALVLGAWGAVRWGPDTAFLLEGMGVPGEWSAILGFLLLFLAVLLLGALLGAALVGLLRKVHLRWTDRIAGAALGALVGLIAAVVTVLAAASFAPEGKDPVEGSLLAPHVLGAARAVFLPLVPEEWKEEREQEGADEESEEDPSPSAPEEP
jgi:membrane protein required for colicin V production